MTKKEAIEKISENLSQVRKLISECVKLAEEHTVCFGYRPDFGGQYTPKNAKFDNDGYLTPPQENDPYSEFMEPQYGYGWETSYC